MENPLLINKMVEHFGPYGLVIYGKSCDYYKTNLITPQEVLDYYNILKSDITIPPYINKQVHLTCCLYYLTKLNVSYQKELLTIIGGLKLKTDELNNENLSLIYNIIEYDDKFLHTDKRKKKFLLAYLNKFTNYDKQFENFLLFKLYLCLLQHFLGNKNEASQEHYEIISMMTDKARPPSDYLNYILLRNDLLKIKLDSVADKQDLREQHIFLNDLYHRVQRENPLLAIKLGFGLYNNLYKQNLLNECLIILEEMKEILKNVIESGQTQKNTVDLYLPISSRMGFIGILLNKKEYIAKAIKKLNKILIDLKNDLNNPRTKILFITYNFSLNLLRLDSNIVVERPREIAATFQKTFFRNDEMPQDQQSLESNIINSKNKSDCFIDLYGFIYNDPIISNGTQKIIEACLQNIHNNYKLDQQNVFLFIIGVHNIVNHFSELYCLEKNQTKREDYKNKITIYTEKIVKFVKAYADNEPMLKTELIKSAIIRIHSCCTHVYIYNKKFDIVKNAIGVFDDISRKLNITEDTPSYELIHKIKGDYLFFQKSYYDSILSYQNAVQKMKDNNPKKAVIYFNMGCIYYYNNNKNMAIDNLNKCVEAFKKLENEISSFEFHKRAGNLTQKKSVAQNLLKLMSKG